jgi:hypothetical protein
MKQGIENCLNATNLAVPGRKASAPSMTLHDIRSASTNRSRSAGPKCFTCVLDVTVRAEVKNGRG